MKTKTISYTQLEVGNVVHFYGARFEITEAQLKDEKRGTDLPPVFMRAQGKWIDGASINGYFGPTKDWHFQGNINARCDIEIPEIVAA